MLLICEPVRLGPVHIPVNASILTAFVLAFPDEDILFCADPTHLAEIRAFLAPKVSSHIRFEPIRITGQHCSLLRRFLSDLRLAGQLRTLIMREKVSYLFFTSISPTQIYSLKLGVIRGVLKHLPTHALLHAGLASAIGWQPRNPFKRISRLRTAMEITRIPALRYLVLEQSIKEVAEHELPVIADMLDVLEHPIAPGEGSRAKEAPGRPIRIGFLGLLTEQKGFFNFLQLAKEVTEHSPGLAEFCVVGRLHEDYMGIQIPNLKYLSGKADFKHFTRSEFISKVRELDFVCFPLAGRHYDLTASGTLLDAVAWEKPVIATMAPIFASLEKRYGEIGYISATSADTGQLVDYLTTLDREKYQNAAANIRKIKLDRDISHTARRLQELRSQLQQ